MLPVVPGSVHDFTAARAHCLPALYATADTGLPTLADKGYTEACLRAHTPIKAAASRWTTAPTTSCSRRSERSGNEPTPSSNNAGAAYDASGCLNRIGTNAAVAIMLSTLQRKRY